ncbi:Glycosyltransferase involved in cell wall bisynthesis [Kaistella chaponensis]|uniref:Glycosyltransferase involved in cell wall bisynthesis n=1 Tax=Kaistella chaponensis TaxID=713588 RepID=A0A1N7MCY0_9FLAO|nr:glycosyltransferase [Kaistella chaponensis]SIS83849.1 Glycosyltransferase involved in cell wall bisynthesis [Kaistella chaponensis]
MTDSQKKIKLLFRHRSMEMGGVEKVMLSIVNNLNPEKFEITVCLNLNQGELRNEFPPHIRKLYLAEGKEDFSKNIILQKIQLYQRKKKLEKLRKNPEIIDRQYLREYYDIEIGMTYNDFESVLNSSNKNSKKIGWFHSEINVPGLKPLLPEILKQFPQFDVMVYCSQKIKDLMHIHHPDLHFPVEKVIINAISFEEIKVKAAEKIEPFSEKPSFVSVGRLHYRKGYHKLIEAHTKLIREGHEHQILIVGEGEHRQNLEKLIKENKVERTFILLGNKMNPYPYIKNADFFILPSESEAWPLVIAEALILQKPIIATDTGDISMMIAPEKTGILIPYKVEEMYYSMKRFLTDKPLISEIKNNLQNIEDQFDNKKIFESIEIMMEQILEK